MTKEKKLTEDDLTASFSSQDMIYTKVPSRIGKLLDFLHGTAFVKNKPDLVEGPVLPKRRMGFPEAEAHRPRLGPLGPQLR